MVTPPSTLGFGLKSKEPCTITQLEIKIPIDVVSLYICIYIIILPYSSG